MVMIGAAGTGKTITQARFLQLALHQKLFPVVTATTNKAVSNIAAVCHTVQGSEEFLGVRVHQKQLNIVQL
jgi:hypothetical protein